MPDSTLALISFMVLGAALIVGLPFTLARAARPGSWFRRLVGRHLEQLQLTLLAFMLLNAAWLGFNPGRVSLFSWIGISGSVLGSAVACWTLRRQGNEIAGLVVAHLREKDPERQIEGRARVVYRGTGHVVVAVPGRQAEHYVVELPGQQIRLASAGEW